MHESQLFFQVKFHSIGLWFQDIHHCNTTAHQLRDISQDLHTTWLRKLNYTVYNYSKLMSSSIIETQTILSNIIKLARNLVHGSQVVHVLFL